MPNNMFFTADTHFGHANIMKYCNRPFSATEEMDETIISNWNQKVKPNDIVYHLGDFTFGDPNEYLSRLNGKITLIIGNHDNRRCLRFSKFANCYDLFQLRLSEKQQICLCHYAMRVWPASHHGAWHLFGHSHGGTAPYGKSFDVGVDCNGFAPLAYEEVVAKMATLEDNHNLIKR